jgi:hypothetical protein
MTATKNAAAANVKAKTAAVARSNKRPNRTRMSDFQDERTVSACFFIRSIAQPAILNVFGRS